MSVSMYQISIPKRFYDFTVGMDSIFTELERVLNTGTVNNYPPHNIEIVEEDKKYILSVALAGFCKEDIEMIFHKTPRKILEIKGEKKVTENKDYAYKGIGYRPFVRKFALASDIEITEATMENGELVVVLERISPKEREAELILIK